jgi:hypothetical protein
MIKSLNAYHALASIAGREKKTRGRDLASVWLPMAKSQQSWVRPLQHPQIQWTLNNLHRKPKTVYIFSNDQLFLWASMLNLLPTEYTQSSNGPMMEKSALAGEGGVHAHPLSLYLPARSMLQCTLQLRGQIHPLCRLYPLYVLCVVTYSHPTFLSTM